MSQPPPEPPREPVFAGMSEDPDSTMDPDSSEIDSAERVVSNLPTDNSTCIASIGVRYVCRHTHTTAYTARSYTPFHVNPPVAERTDDTQRRPETSTVHAQCSVTTTLHKISALHNCASAQDLARCYCHTSDTDDNWDTEPL